MAKKIHSIASTGGYASNPQLDLETKYIANPVVLLNGSAAAMGGANTYLAFPNDYINITVDIVNTNGGREDWIDQVALGYPGILKVPVVKVIGGYSNVIVDEIYLTVSIVSGVLSIAGRIPISGNWKILPDRVNKSLQAIGATWKLEVPKITFLI